MSSSTETPTTQRSWAPDLDLTPQGISRFDPARVQQAIESGYATGYEAGRAQADADARAELEATLATVAERTTQVLDGLRVAGEQLAAAEAATATSYATAVADAATAIARAVIGRELAEPTDAALAAVGRALSAVERSSQVRIQLHPEDMELLRTTELPAGTHLEPNPGLRPGDAVAHTDDRTVDARIQHALDRARTELETPPC